jgi:hypothetical protein
MTLQALTRHPRMRDILSEQLFRLSGAGFGIVVGHELVVPSILASYGLGLRKTGNNGLFEGWQVGYGGLIAAATGSTAAPPLSLVSAAQGQNASTTGCEYGPNTMHMCAIIYVPYHTLPCPCLPGCLLQMFRLHLPPQSSIPRPLPLRPPSLQRRLWQPQSLLSKLATTQAAW